ncbi:MAG: hypothetical protein U5L09_11015 [Bacteroidales bacterium]|nr:hypothetical protein [Bacteroidales bacterium]
MNLKDKISKLGHYAHKGLRSAIKPLTIGLAGLSLIASTYSQAKAQNEADTVYGTGIFTTFNEENDNRVKDVLLSLTPENMATDHSRYLLPIHNRH